MKVLIAENDPRIVEAYRKTFPRFGIEFVDVAGDAPETIAKYQKHGDQIDFLICNNRLAPIGGVETARRILAFDPRAVIILAYEDAIDESYCRQLGICAVVKMPFAYRNTIHRIFNVLAVQATGQK